VRSCPACESTLLSDRGVKADFPLVQCTACSTLFTENLPTEEDLAALYDIYYDEAKLECPGFLYGRLDEVVRHLEDYRRLNRWLDVGFGAGLLMLSAERLGWQPIGTEVSEAAFVRMRDRGLEVHLGDLESCGFSAESFDVVSMVEVIEHVNDPLALIGEAARLLRPGGGLYLTTPNSQSLSYRTLRNEWSVVTPPHHLQLFSLKGVEAMLSRVGLTVVKAERVALNPSEFRALLPGQDSISAEVRVESAHQLNERMLASPLRRKVRGGLNRTLSLFGIGDTLKVLALKG